MKFFCKIIVFFLIFTFFLPSVPGLVEANNSEEELKEKIEELRRKIAEKKAEEKTLSSIISYYDNKIKLTTAEITQIERKIAVLKKEIAGLTLKIGRLDESLEVISQLLLLRIIETYKKGRINPLYLFFTSDGFSQFLTRYKYLKIVQANDRNLLYQMEQTRFNYDLQKNLKEEKQEQIERLKEQLEAKKTNLAQQKKEKEVLLGMTRSDKERYQELLAEATAQLRKLKSFTAGRELIAPVDLGDDWGKYYSQLDSRWGENFIGNSGDQIWEVGCLVTSVAMVWTHFGENVTPAEIAADSSNFFALTAYMNRPWIPSPGHSWIPYGGRTTKVPEEWIKQELADGNPVIVGLIITSGPLADHFVVVKGVDGSGNLLINDPLTPKQNIKLREYYPNAILVNAASYN